MTPLRKWQVVRIILTTLYLMAGWLLFTWTLNIRSMLLGLCFAFLIALNTYGLFFDKRETHRKYLLPRWHFLVFYVFYLLFRIYAASFKLLPMIFTRNFNPRVVHFRTRLKSDIARVGLSNSITMTPGTIAINLDDDHLIVHWMDAKTSHSRYASRLITGWFEAILKRIWI